MKHQQVVVAYDFSEMGAAVLARAVALVQRAPSHILHFVTVLDPHDGDYQYADSVRDRLTEEIKKAFGSTPISSEIHFFVHARIGKPGKEILDLAEELGADLILVGTHGRTGIPRLILGSTAEYLVREAGCPVLVVRPKRYADIELPTVTEVEAHHSKSRATGYTISSSGLTQRPFQWLTP